MGIHALTLTGHGPVGTGPNGGWPRPLIHGAPYSLGLARPVPGASEGQGVPVDGAGRVHG